MKREDVIRHFERYINDDCYTIEHREACRIAVAAIREQEERENPKQLTLGELRNMIGEPVWIETGGFNAWGIVCIDDESIYVNSKSLEGYNIQWRINTVRAIRCYRYKPKEDAT